jgi:tRNA A37 methylthiotransferase MiaB
MSRLPRVVPHLHLCLQSGSDRILLLMRRRYTAAGFLERCRRLRDALDRPALTTDVIVGFPGETDEDFDHTCRVIRAAHFTRIHVFSYSTRAGTPAAGLGPAIASAVVDRRREIVKQLELDLAVGYYRELVGRTLDVLVEGADPVRPGNVLGTACRYVPVSLPGIAAALTGKRIPARVVHADSRCVLAEPTPPAYNPSDGLPRIALPVIGGGRTDFQSVPSACRTD